MIIALVLHNARCGIYPDTVHAGARFSVLPWAEADRALPQAAT